MAAEGPLQDQLRGTLGGSVPVSSVSRLAL